MPYRYLPDIAIADVAFEAWADSLAEVFMAAADAAMNVMVGDLETIAEKEVRNLEVEDSELDLLLLQLLQELIFYKDAQKLLLKVKHVEIHKLDDRYALRAEARGEELDPGRHDLVVDVKAVTLHRLRLEQTPRGWEATVVLDI